MMTFTLYVKVIMHVYDGIILYYIDYYNYTSFR